MERWNRLAPWLVALVASVIYFLTLCPSVDKIDAGELATVQITGGVAHPTGYPLFTMLGFLFSKLPTGLRPIVQQNVLSLLWVAIGAFFMCKALILLLGQLKVSAPVANKNAKSKSPVKENSQPWLSPQMALLCGVAAALWLAFSKTWWEQATSIEVYSLQAMLLSILFFFVIKAAANPESRTNWIAVAVSFGFCLTNHVTAGLIAPAIVVLFFMSKKIDKDFLKTGLLLAGISVSIVVVIYAWLPIRSGSDPALNWENISDWRGLRFHVTGQQFSNFLFGGEGGESAAQKNLSAFGSGLPGEFGYLGLIPALIGLGFIFMRDKRMAIFSVISFVATVVYVINYDIKDLEPYFLTPYIVFALWIGVGLGAIATMMMQVKQSLPILAAGFVLGIGLEAGINYSRNDKSDLWFYEDYARAAMESLPTNSIVVTYQWDWLVSPSYYLQQVEHLRPDVVILDYHMMRDRPWYANHIKRNFPDVYQKLSPTIERFNKALTPFHYKEEFDGAVLSETFQQLWFTLMNEKEMGRPVFIGPEVRNMEMLQKREVGLPKELALLPEHFFYRVVTMEAIQKYIPLQPFEYMIRFDNREEPIYTETIRVFLADLASDRSKYEMQLNHLEEAKKFEAKSTKIRSEMRQAEE